MNITTWQHLLTPVLIPLGHAYAKIMALRASAYSNHIFPTWQPTVPCISVGNISWGGTGKTPMVSWILDWAARTHRHPAVLTRGYHALPPHVPFHVQAASLPSQAGDEPLMLAKKHPQADIVVDPKRIRSGPWAERTLQPDLFILDDGFQHLAVQRQIDLVLLAPDDLGKAWDNVIPSGSWREGSKALQRAHAFIVNTTGASLDRLLPLATKRLGYLHKPIYFVELFPTGLRHLTTGRSVLDVQKEPYFLFTGIANPERVIRTATALLKSPPEDHLFFPDHHSFTLDDLSLIRERTTSCGAKHILCTTKDGIKISPCSEDPIWEIQTTIRFMARLNTSLWLAEYLEQKIQKG
ncbi:MAG: tetraacyldisaccharide 4'-kinase [Desulfoplanes sp.]